MLILAVDPGGRHKKHTPKSPRGTGWILIEANDEVVKKWAGGLIVGSPEKTIESMVSGELREALNMSTQLVVENFVKLNPRADPSPLETVGAMRMEALLSGKPLSVRMPGQRNLVSHDDLKRIGWWPGGAGHADEASATCHGLSWLLDHGHLPTAMLVNPPPPR